MAFLVQENRRHGTDAWTWCNA